MESERRERDILWIFDLALILKAINGVLEVLAAVAVLFVSRAFVVRVVWWATGGELGLDPDDPIALALRNAAHSFAIHTHYFISLYLAIHGIAKLVLIGGIFAGKKIAYPIFMIVLVLFGLYEVYRGYARHEVLLYFLALFDFVLVFLTLHEYRRRYGTTLRPGTDSRA